MSPLLWRVDKRERMVATRIAGEVRRLRAGHGWSQLALAERADMSINYVSLIERAERLPSLEILMKLAAALGTTIAALVDEAPAEDPWLAETGAILRALPAEARPMVLGILRGAAEAAAPQKSEASGVRPKRRRKK